jgi:predicted dehydrogenase
MVDSIGLAAIGAGGIFQGSHMPQYLKIPEVDFLGLFDVDRNRAEAALKKYEDIRAELKGEESRSEPLPKIYGSIDEIVKDEEVAMVDVCSPPFARDMIIDLLHAGKNVCAEKPMCRNYLEAKPIAQAAKDSGSLYQHNENWCYDGHRYTLQKLIGEDLGVPFVGIHSEGHGGPEGREWFWDPELGGGGTLLDNGIHPITGSWYLLGFDEWRPTRVKAVKLGIKYPWRMIGGIYQRVRVEDHAHVKIIYENDSGDVSMALVEASWSWTYLSSFIQAEKGAARTEGGDIVMDIYGYGERRIKVPGIHGTWGELNNFAQCILRKQPSITNEDIGLESMAMVGAAYLSKLRGRTVTMEEFTQWAEEIGDHNKLRSELLKACY